MQLVLPREAVCEMDELKALNECASYGEIIRRAVHLLERATLKTGIDCWKDVGEENLKMSHRLQVIISSQTLTRIEDLSQLGGSLNSKSKVIRAALQLYANVSKAQREMRDYDIKGPRGTIKSSLVVMP